MMHRQATGSTPGFVFAGPGFTVGGWPIGDSVGGRRARSSDILYVAVPGVRDYLEYGGHGLLVFDIDDDYKFVKRIRTGGLAPGRPLNVKGICGSAATGRLYISTIKQLMCLEIAADTMRWERHVSTAAATGCRSRPTGRRSICRRSKGRTGTWSMPKTATCCSEIVRNSGAHNTIVRPVAASTPIWPACDRRC